MALVDPSVAVPKLERPQRRSLLASLWANPSGRVGCVLAAIVVLAAICGAVGLTPYPAQSQNPVANLKAPSFAHLLGTDQFGRDMFSLVLQGLYVSLKISCVAVAIAGVLGTLAGIVAGYLGRWVSAVIMRTTDMLFAIPAILLALAIVTALGAGWLNSALAIGVGYIPIFVRVVRGPCWRYAMRGTSGQAGCSGSRLLACFSATSSQTSPEWSLCKPALRWHGRCLPRRPLVSSAWAARADRVTGRNGLQLDVAVAGSYGVVDTGWAVTGGRYCSYRVQFLRRRLARRHRPQGAHSLRRPN